MLLHQRREGGGRGHRRRQMQFEQFVDNVCSVPVCACVNPHGSEQLKYNAGPSREQSHPREPMQLPASMRALSTTYDEDRMPTSPQVTRYLSCTTYERMCVSVCVCLYVFVCVGCEQRGRSVGLSGSEMLSIVYVRFWIQMCVESSNIAHSADDP